MSEPADNITLQQGANITHPQISDLKKKVQELCNVKNISFLFGAGASSDAIPDMKSIKKALDEEIESEAAKHKGVEHKNSELIALHEAIGKDNLEELLNVLYAKQFYLKGINDKSSDLKTVNKLIKYIQGFMFKKINITFDSDEAIKTLELYKTFYQKIALRNKDLSRINIFTTNNDLFNEKSLDYLNINYNNGFGGGLDKVFNPARFQYTYSKKVDLNLEKFEPLENMVYLYKLHGSVNWLESETNSLFNIKEITLSGGEDTQENPALVYPTPLKQNQSLGSPYSDLIREFQVKLTLSNSVLFVIGYSFSDEHLNNIIYRALTSNASLSIVIFGKLPKCNLQKMADNRVYSIHGITEYEGEADQKIHYFNYIVNELIPEADENRDSTLLENFAEALTKLTKD